ncbi:ester cyclase [Neorhizobium sp. T7_12]|uniref:ester cyclase n=1 Tax=Neorhizobium sp. T7_12 TaxID=2093832 RepID=UPI00155F4D50|nr:ester cyclase [Neorhizobium sp. T7_12]
MRSIAGAIVVAVISAGPVSAQQLTVEQARAIVAPWYDLFSVQKGHDVKAVHEQVYTEDFQSCSGDRPADCHDRDASIQMIAGFAQIIPDLKLEIKGIFVSGDKIIVRSEAKGTPAGEFFGVPHTGRSFDLMGIDILTVRGGKVSHTYHIENWIGAINQLRGE